MGRPVRWWKWLLGSPIKGEGALGRLAMVYGWSSRNRWDRIRVMSGFIIARDDDHLREWAHAKGTSPRDYTRVTQVGDIPLGGEVICLLPLKHTTVELIDLRGVTIIWPPGDKKAMKKSAHRMYDGANNKDPGTWVEYKGMILWGNPATRPFEVL